MYVTVERSVFPGWVHFVLVSFLLGVVLSNCTQRSHRKLDVLLAFEPGHSSSSDGCKVHLKACMFWVSGSCLLSGKQIFCEITAFARKACQG